MRTDPTLLEYIRLYMEYTPDQRETLLSDVEIVTTAVAQFGGAIRYACDACRNNNIVVMTALTSTNPTRLDAIPSSLALDPCVRLCHIPEKGQSSSMLRALLTFL